MGSLPDTRRVLLVGWASDVVLDAVEAACRNRGVSTERLEPRELGDQVITLRSDGLFAGSGRVGGLFLRFHSDCNTGEGFAAGDRSFVTAELRAVLMCAMNLPGVLSINRATPQTWFQGVEWTVWRDRFRGAGVRVAPLAYGDVEDGDGAGAEARWKPYLGTRLQCLPEREARRALGCAVTRGAQDQRSVVCFGRVVEGEASPEVKAAAGVMASYGTALAEILTDAQERICHVNSVPFEMKEQTREHVAAEVAERYFHHLHRR
jgi:hypothetical protein